MHPLLKALSPVLALVALCALGVFISCGNGNQAQVRFVHGVADTTTLDIEFNGTVDFRGVGFHEVQPTSGYTAVPAGSDTVEALATGTTTEAFTVSNVNVTAGTQYTMIASGPNASAVTINSYADDNNAPADSFVNFRVINAAPQGPSSVFVYIDANPVVGNGCTTSSGDYVVNNLAPNQASSYVTVPYLPNGYSIYVCNSAGGDPLAGDSGYSVTAGSSTEGSVRTIIFMDNSSGTYMSLPQPLVLDDLN
jgi:Domain of unknown function (DUF4397)